MKYIIERVPREIRIRPFMAVAYFDWCKNSSVTVLYPFHYLVMLAWWLNGRWCMHKNKPSWIDKQVIAAMDKRY